MRRFIVLQLNLFLWLTCACGILQAQELKPLSTEDRAKVQELLKSFDPNSYDFRYQYVDSSGQVQAARAGKARGLANLRQRETARAVSGTAASTNTNINIFRQASTNTN